MNRGFYSEDKDDVIPKYLEHICQNDKSLQLKKYDDDFESHYLRSIEKRVQVYNTDRGLIDVHDDFDPTEFKRIQEEIIIKFKESNKERFRVDEEVTLEVNIKNVPELVIKVFEFNTETYYKKNLKPFDTSINLHGMVPSILRTEKEMFKNVPKNKILAKTFTFEELKGKVGLFIIEMQGNGRMSRAVVKKGSLSLIHKSTSAGHLAYIIDADRKICKSERTGVWIKKKFYQCDLDKNGSIFIPYGQTVENTKIIMIHEDFA